MIYAATGHRPDKTGGYADPFRKKLERFAQVQIREFKPELVIVGMALGWDQAVAAACIAEHRPFNAYLPFRGQEMMWPKKSQDYYHELLKYANDIRICSPYAYSVEKMQIRNMYMVDDAEHMLALWNGSDGGTKNCLDYAAKKKRPVTNVWSAWKAF